MTKKNTTEIEEGKKKKPRSANYSSREDEGIAKAWGSATQNEIKGNYQDQKKYWQTILEKYQVFAKDNNLPERSLDSLQARWRTINHACTKFNGIYLQISRVGKSGWNDEKYQAEAEAIYLEEVKEKFCFFGCWLFLKGHPKWSIGQTTLREIVTVSGDDQTSVDGEAKGKKASVAERPIAERPQGQKAAKSERKQQKSKDSLDEMNAESLQLRAIAHADSVTFNVMSKLGFEHPVAKEWFELKGRVALDKLRLESEQMKLSLKKVEAAAKSKLSEDEEASKLLQAATAERPPIELTFDSASSLTATSSSSSSNNLQQLKQTVNVCSAGDYCVVSNGHKVACTQTCRVCEKSCHLNCCDSDEYNFKICNSCAKEQAIEQV